MAVSKKSRKNNASRKKACSAIKKYCKTTKCKTKKYRESTKYRKKMCGHSLKICKHTTCNTHKVVKK